MENSIEHMERFTFIEGSVGRLEKLLVRGVEEFLGKREIARIYRQVVEARSSGKTFWKRAVDQLELKIRVNGLPLEQIPQGPLLVVANHPFGQIDGVVLSHLIETFRPDYRVVAWEILNAADQLDDVVLPICFKEEYSAKRKNLITLRRTIETLKEGRTVILFPAGAAATSPTWFGPAVDAPWQKFLSKLVLATNLTVLPVYFHGQNSRLFQISSHLSYHLKLSLFFHEMKRMRGREVQVTLGTPLSSVLDQTGRDELQILEFLYQTTMQLREQRAHPFEEFVAESWTEPAAACSQRAA